MLTFNKDLVTCINIDEMFKEVDGNKVTIHEASGQFTIINKKALIGHFSWGGLNVETESEKISLGEVSFDTQQEVISGDYYLGDAIATGDVTFLVSSFEINDANGDELTRMKKFAITLITTVEKELMKVNLSYHADEINTAGQEFINANFELALDNLDIKVMQELGILFSQYQGDVEELLLEDNITQLTAVVTKLLEKNPTLKIKDISFETPEGKLATVFNLSINKDKFDLANMMSGIQAVNADANAHIPEAFIAKLGFMPIIEPYVEQGFLIRSEDELSFTLIFSAGILQINGQVVPL